MRPDPLPPSRSRRRPNQSENAWRNDHIYNNKKPVAVLAFAPGFLLASRSGSAARIAGSTRAGPSRQMKRQLLSEDDPTTSAM
jgi:hypothetical protein